MDWVCREMGTLREVGSYLGGSCRVSGRVGRWVVSGEWLGVSGDGGVSSEWVCREMGRVG